MAMTVLLASSLLIAAPVTGGTASLKPFLRPLAQSRYAAAIESVQSMIRAEMADKQLPAISIALVDDQEVVWSGGFGLSDPDRKLEATADTVYRVGSVSKLFTDIAVMQLVEQGKLNLDAPVADYIPEFHPRNSFGKPITLRELMSHHSGLVREPPVGHYFDPTSPSLERTVLSLNETSLVYEPRTHAKYSNAAIATVGYVLQRVTGQPFTEYVKQAVLGPLGLRHSAFEPEPELTKDLAKAYMWSYDGRTFEAPKFQLGMSPAGSMYSTVRDLARFASVLFAGGRAGNIQVLKPETLEQMWTPQFEKTGYGIGFRLSRMDGHRWVGHGGAIYGFATELAALPDDKLGVVVVTTDDSANAVVNHIADQALRLMLAARNNQALPGAETSQPFSADEAIQLEGRYSDGTQAVELTEQKEHLYFNDLAGGQTLELKKLGGALVTDSRLDYGRRIEPASGGINIDGRFLKKTETGQPRPIPSEWKGLIGEYGWDHDVLYITERDGKLTALIEWFEYDPLTEISKNVFKFPDHGLYDRETLTFTRDARGNAIAARVGYVDFKRRPVGTEAGVTFKVKPRQSGPGLEREALAAHPPKESGDYRAPDLVELTTLDPTIKLDIRYATTNNFMSTVFYSQARAFMQRPAAEALKRVVENLKVQGYGLLIHDAYRPWYVTKMFWDATPLDKHIFVADPSQGSRHNRGCAVDLSIYYLKTGHEVEMVGGYDEMSERSYPFYPGGTSLQRYNRTVLRRAMEAEGFTVYEFEWWHFDYKDWSKYPILNVRFEEIKG
jgi:CubicO group peptidase (beta-lactamase class C family)/D-alanyl-D-alanine dipeptidase